MKALIPLCANFVRNNCPDDVMELVSLAMNLDSENSDLKRQVVDAKIELARLTAENEFLLRTVASSEESE